MNRLQELRSSRGISMKEAARQIGIPYTTYVNYEKGLREPNSETLIALANFFNTSIDYLLGAPQKEKNPATEDEELGEYFEILRTRPEMRMLFRVSKDATKADVEKAVAIIEALRKTEG